MLAAIASQATTTAASATTKTILEKRIIGGRLSAMQHSGVSGTHQHQQHRHQHQQQQNPHQLRIFMNSICVFCCCRRHNHNQLQQKHFMLNFQKHILKRKSVRLSQKWQKSSNILKRKSKHTITRRTTSTTCCSNMMGSNMMRA